jgi:ornithine cyclodeaminase/alanine dehydrogenase-like protein (mu-crystallin family)
VCTLTSSRDPILKSTDIDSGTHVNAVGFGGPTARELPGDLMARARIFVDSLDGARNESGNLILAAREGQLPGEPAVTLLCDVLTGRAPGRQNRDDVTIFDSLGIAIEDLACAQLAFERARAGKIGTTFQLAY